MVELRGQHLLESFLCHPSQGCPGPSSPFCDAILDENQILSETKNERRCEMCSCAVKVTQKPWLSRPNDNSFHTVSDIPDFAC